MEIRGDTNAFSVGGNTSVLIIPKEIAEEFDIEHTSKKTHFDIYTDYSNGKKRIIYEFTKHIDKKPKEQK